MSKYTLGPIKQLIDLNGTLVNFHLEFTIKSDGKVFEAVVVTQRQLDNDPNIQYKMSSEGVLTGTITYDRNEHQNFLLLLKSTDVVDVDVDVKIHPIPPAVVPLAVVPQKPAEPSKSSIVTFLETWKWPIIYFILLCIAGYLVYNYMYGTKVQDIAVAVANTTSTQGANPSLKFFPEPAIRKNHYIFNNKSPTPKQSSPSVKSTSSSNSMMSGRNILNKLNSL